MNGILVIVLGVATLYLVISGKLDCLIKALQACSGPQGNTPAAAPTSTAPTAPTAPTPAQALNTVLSSNVT